MFYWNHDIIVQTVWYRPRNQLDLNMQFITGYFQVIAAHCSVWATVTVKQSKTRKHWLQVTGNHWHWHGWFQALRVTAIRSLIRSERSAIKTWNSLKEYSYLIPCQKESFLVSSVPNKHISKSNNLKRDSELLNLVSKCAQYWQKESIHVLSIYKLWNHLVFVHLLSSCCCDISDNKVLAALRCTYETQNRIDHPGYRAVQLRHTSHQWGLRFVQAL